MFAFLVARVRLDLRRGRRRLLLAGPERCAVAGSVEGRTRADFREDSETCTLVASGLAERVLPTRG